MPTMARHPPAPSVTVALTNEERFVMCSMPELFNDRLYTREDWDRHVTWYRHLPEPVIFVKVLCACLPVILWTTSFSVVVGLYWRFLEPAGAPAIVASRDYGPVLQVASIALSLLLVFRTNSSYARWQEGRQLTGIMLNHCRNLARIAIACVPPAKSEQHRSALDAILRFTAALGPAAASFLKGDPGMLRYLCSGVLLEEEISFLERASATPAPPPPPAPAQLLARAQRTGSIGGRRPSGEGGRRPSGESGGGGSKRPSLEAGRIPSSPCARPAPPSQQTSPPAPAAVPSPVVVCQVLSALLARAGLDSVDRQACEAFLSGFDVALGGCQRLASSPIPAAYSRHTSRFMMGFLMLLPIVLFPSLGWFTLPVIIILTYLLAGVENIGVQIENPIRTLPLRALARSYRDAVLSGARVSGECADMADGIVCSAGIGGGAGKDGTRRSPFL